MIQPCGKTVKVYCGTKGDIKSLLVTLHVVTEKIPFARPIMLYRGDQRLC